MNYLIYIKMKCNFKMSCFFKNKNLPLNIWICLVLRFFFFFYMLFWSSFLKAGQVYIAASLKEIKIVLRNSSE